MDIDKILVVTFTNAAASEMRERILDAIYKKIEESPDDANLQKQIILLNKASICTIDSFCLDVIKNNFYEIDVSANTRIADGTEILLLKQEVLDDIFEEKYIENDKDFLDLIDTYTKYNRDEDLKDLILNIYTYIQASPFPEEWLEEKVKMFDIKENAEYSNFSNTPWGKIIIQNVDEILKNGILKLQNLKRKMERFPELEKYTNVVNEDINNYLYIKENLKDWDKSATIISEFKNKTWPTDKKITNDLKDEAKDIRDSVKDEFKKVKDLINCLSQEANDDIEYMYTILEKLKNLILEFSDRFYQKKREKNIMDFNDMEHLALKMLVKKDELGNVVKTDIAKRYEEKFEEIDIDEYQDSNLVQEYILTSVSKGNNIFMVGDVKQSIYKFRQARPQLFIEKYNKYKLYPGDSEDRKIQLFKNFRSRKNILDFTNLVFENIMSKELGDIDYNQDEYLNLGASYVDISEQNLKTEIEIIDTSDEDNDIWKTEQESDNGIENTEGDNQTEERVEDVVLEARFVAKKIKELIDSKYQVVDKKLGKRDIKYKDISILLRSMTGVANIYEKEISELGIPVYSDSSGEYLQSIEIETIMSLLRIINNPMQDIPLITVMRSPIGNFTDNELIEIRMNDRNSNFYDALTKTATPKVKKFLGLLEELREDEQYMALDEWIWNIYIKTGYMNYVSLMPNGNLRVSNLKMLFERAKQYESASFKGLFNFINFIDKTKFNSEDLTSAKIIGENENVVRIMSIHKSKGLEFPVVILAGTGKQFNFQDLNEKILLDQDLGIGPQYINSERHIEFKTLAKKALSIKAKNEAISEEMRVLYVALTRAKEKLIVVGRQKDVNKKMSDKQKVLEIYSEDNKKINPYLLQKYKTYLDWIELIYLKEGTASTKDVFSVNINKKADLIKNSKQEDNEIEDIYAKIKNNAESHNNVENQEAKDKIKQFLNWQYPYTGVSEIPTKTSVTKIKELANAELIQERTKDLKIDIQEDSTQTSISAKPKFLKDSKDNKITNAQKGTVMHLCVQKMNEKEEYDLLKIQDLIEELRTKELISSTEADCIDANRLLEYTKSNLWQELKEAKEINKEKAFYINVKASKLYDNISNEIDENILVQGVIDLYYIDKNDNLVLVDYKTDYVEKGKEELLVEKYKEQLNLYKEALEKSLNRKVKNMGIYSLYLNQFIQINI
ncbi:MAG: helicase-exonuclease AddAB subunit AddA [Clostridia bacterium]